MANLAKWVAGTQVGGAFMGTELNSAGIGAYILSTASIDNTAALDEWAVFDIVLASLLPTAGANLVLYIVYSADGTTFEDAPSATNPGTQMDFTVVSLNVTTSAKRVTSSQIRIRPLKFKVCMLNNAGVAFNAAGNTIVCRSFNENLNG